MPPTGAAVPQPRGWRARDDVAIADVAFEAWGPTLEEAFLAAAEATVATMSADPGAIAARQRRTMRLEEAAADLLLYRFLEELVYYKDAEGLLLRVASVRIEERDGGLALEAQAEGEALDPARHGLLADVKAVTLHRLRVERTERGWTAFVVLDV
ncbi:MAG TPA: archease [bacterium]